MTHRGIAYPRHLSILYKVLDDYCQRYGIAANASEREDIAAMIVSFYELGMVTEEDLAEALDGLRSRRLSKPRHALAEGPGNGAP